MHRGAVNLHSRAESAPVRIEAFEGRKQGRVDIEYAAFPAFDEPRRQQAHETRKTDEVGCPALDCLLHGALEAFTIAAEGRVFYDGGRDSGRFCPAKPSCIGLIWNSPWNFGGVRRI